MKDHLYDLAAIGTGATAVISHVAGWEPVITVLAGMVSMAMGLSKLYMLWANWLKKKGAKELCADYERKIP